MTTSFEATAIRRFQELLRIPTVSGNGPKGAYQDCANWLVTYLNELGLTSKVISPLAGKPIVLSTWEGKDPKLPGILLNSHYDVVPVMKESWKYEPFGAEIREDGMIIARGTQDMKSVCVQYVEALRLLKESGFTPARNIHLCFVPDEEIGGIDGMGELLKSEEFKALQPIAIALDEGLANPTEKFTVFYGERTPWWIYVKAEGPTGHGSRFIENTATSKLITICNKALAFRAEQEKALGASCGCKHGDMKKKKLGDVTTINLTMLKSGVSTDGGNTYALNVIPTEATAGFDIRISPNTDLSEFQNMLDQWCEAEGVSWKYAIRPLHQHHITSVDEKTNPLCHRFMETCKELGMEMELEVFPAATDSRFLRQLGIPALGFSPMNNTEILLHEHNEMLHKNTFVQDLRWSILHYDSMWRLCSPLIRALGSRHSTTMVCTPIYYVNARPHLGHLHSTVMADALSRWFKLRGDKTLFTTGTDEHGLKVQQAAERAGKDTKEFCDDVAATFQAMCTRGNIDYDRFVRTTEPDHKVAVENFWKTLIEKDAIYLGEHEAWYCVSDETFLTEMQVESVDGKMISKESGHPVELVKEENYKFRLSAFQNVLLEWLDANPDVIQPKSRFNEVRSMVQSGLHDVSVSRLREKIQWAIPVPGDANHSVYVWLDALSNYLTCAGYPNSPNFNQTWPPNYHIVGKDIIKFHAIYWPAFLYAANLELPKRIVAHAHWTVNNVKMSKSLGNVVDPNTIIDTFGVDAVRYFLLREGVLTDDGDFNEELLKNRVNSEVADTLGNLVIRSTTLAFLPNGEIPAAGDYSEEDKKLIEGMNDMVDATQTYFEKPDFSMAIRSVIFYLHDINRYFSNNEPWVAAKELKTPENLTPEEIKHKKQFIANTMYISMEAARISALLLSPVIPETSQGILDYMNVPMEQRTLAHAKFNQSQYGPIKNAKSKTKFVPFQKLG
ncbi:methionyl-tRNA synthetase [Thraustotheca clavata]|uniref:N-acyl-L-amino-acid amidohydrolase n=1 Tax=Thraustotheca clavata TaxID=74557 RepID=A0A1V9ZXH5_9STRA|nr:methionyl-tRNA synthetase [Thraustotheca clavata]